MIEVNIWLSTTRLFGKKIKHGLFGPALASERRGENVGHVNFILNLDERSHAYKKLQTSNFAVKKTVQIIPEVVRGAHDPVYKQNKVNSLQVTHSFWPKDKPGRHSVLKDCLHLLHLGKPSKGVQAEFATHEDDMKREVAGELISIEHGQIDESFFQTERQKNLDNYIAQQSMLESRLDELKQIEKIIQKEKVYETINLFEKKQLASIARINFINKKLSYQTSLSNPDETTRREIKRAKEELMHLQATLLSLNEEKQVISHEHATLKKQLSNKELKYVKRNLSGVLDQLVREINENEKKLELLKITYKQKVDSLAREERFARDAHITTGTPPEHSICLPTSESGLRFYINEFAVLEAMEKEKKEVYSFMLNNCATSIKRCLLAGIDENLKNRLQETGVRDSFFELHQVETCRGLQSWIIKLESKLIMLNSAACDDVASHTQIMRC
ncbi:hypothetical protein [Legionella fairfieldensis]|uniref:hypothetical protein n=1 Tax=Legionella fairfieldensis TaxID=45064 RepID=UPI00048AAF37|nr:hypothetical protein [Legionella fairfieldensis]